MGYSIRVVLGSGKENANYHLGFRVIVPLK